MAWRIVKQPNGLLARWSDVVDNFTAVDMTQEEAIVECMLSGCDIATAELKVYRGLTDEACPPWVERTSGDGLDRWREAIETIELIHGKAALQEVLDLIASP